MQSKTIFDKNDVVNFIKAHYFEKKNKIIGPIMLQKTLYFLFAYWCGFVEYAKNNKDNEVEISYPCYLFEPSFTAWAFGPVDISVYEDFKENKTYNEEQYKNFFNEVDSTVEEFVMCYINKCFNTSEFGLSDVSRKDMCWKRHRHCGNKTIPPEEIVKEYTNKYRSE